MQVRAGRVVSITLGLLLLAVAMTALISPRPPFTAYRQPVVVGATVALVTVGLLWRPPVWLRRVLRWSGTPWLVAVAGGWVAAVVGTSLRFPWSWDVRMANTIAEKLHTGLPLYDRQVAYLSLYPNVHPLVAVHRAAFAVSDATGWPSRTVLVSLVAVAAGLAVLLVHPLVTPVTGRVRAVGAQLVVVALVATSPWMAVPYTDILAMPLLTGAVVLVLRAARRLDGLGLVQLVTSSALAAGAVTLKTTPAVLVVAVTVTGLLLVVDLRREWRPAVVALAGTALWVGLTLGLVGALSASATTALGRTAPGGLIQDASPPTMWWVAIGMTETQSPGNPPRYGGYNAAMVGAVADLDREAATQWSREWIAGQWNSHGFGELAAFYGNKAAWTWGDGMFWAWGEGQDAVNLTMPPVEGVAGFVVDVDGRFGRWYPLRCDLTQGLWLAVLLVTGLGALRARAPSRDVLLVGLGVLGIAVFSLVFQGRSRYLLTFVPLVAALAGMVRYRPVRSMTWVGERTRVIGRTLAVRAGAVVRGGRAFGTPWRRRG